MIEEDLQWSREDRIRNDESAAVHISPEEAAKKFEEMEQKMNDDQRHAFETIIENYNDPEGGRLFFLQV